MAGMPTLTELADQQDPHRGIVRIGMNRISFSEMSGAKRLREGRISHDLLMNNAFKFRMDRVVNPFATRNKQIDL
jgi:hypothetical protein